MPFIQCGAQAIPSFGCSKSEFLRRCLLVGIGAEAIDLGDRRYGQAAGRADGRQSDALHSENMGLPGGIPTEEVSCA